MDFLAESGQSFWQVLPLGPTGFADSPYQCLSAFAGNPLLISLDRLVDHGLLSRGDLRGLRAFHKGRVDFGRVIESRKLLLDRAFDNVRRSDHAWRDEVAAFRSNAGGWIEDYALFRALRDANGGAAWIEWPGPLSGCDLEALRAVYSDLAERVEAHVFFQYLFFKQWSAIKNYCNERGIGIVGDLPIFVAFDSADVWAHRRLFKLGADGRPAVVAGVPPDYFSSTGQLWGNPVYDWDILRATGYQWWIDRMKAAFQVFDAVRVDHFRGFAACWEVPSSHETAESGQWVAGPGREIFHALQSAMGTLPIIAEDLGLITPDVEELRKACDFPGMRVLQFAFGSGPDNANLPHNYEPQTVVYTGTHDNDTTIGWFTGNSESDSTRSRQEIERERKFCLSYLGSDGKQIHWDCIRAALSSVADVAIIPAQDLLGLDSSARMNVPARSTGNWGWRLRSGALSRELSERLREMTENYGRLVKGSERQGHQRHAT